MKINNRLKTIGDLVPLSSYPLDIGCDHALLSIYLVKEKNIPKAVASDNKSGPLKKAKENIKFYKVEDKVELIKAEGLDSYKEGIDTITISGMGGLNINRILEDNKKYLKNTRQDHSVECRGKRNRRQRMFGRFLQFCEHSVWQKSSV